MDAFDALKAIRYRAFKTGGASGRGQSGSPKGAFTVSQYLDAQSILYQPEVEAPPEEGAACAVQLALPVIQGESAQLALPIASIEQNPLLDARLVPAERPQPAPEIDAEQNQCWDQPHLSPIRENAYRILGLSGDTEFPTIQQRADELALQARLGKTCKTDWDLEWIWPVERTEAIIQEALWRLGDPEMRLREKLFWFTGEHDGAVLSRSSAEKWRRESRAGTLPNPKPGHDSAIYMLLRTASVDFKVRLEAWRKTLALWRQVAADDSFWNALKIQEAQGRFLRPVSGADIARLRKSCLLHVTEGLVSQARQALTDGDDSSVEAFLAVVNDTGLPEYIDEQIETAIFGFMKGDLERLYDDVLAEDYRKGAVDKLKKELLPLYGRLNQFLKPDSSLRKQAQETVLQCFYRLLTLWGWAGDELDFFYLRKEARRIASPDSLVLPRIELLVKGIRNE